MSNLINPSSTTLALSISNQAKRLLNDYLSQPSINGITIYTYEFNAIYDSLVSKQMIIDQQGSRIAYSDNQAIRPKEWTLKGYLKPSPSELTFLFMPSVEVQKTLLEKFQNLKLPVIFKDSKQRTFNVFIENIEFPEMPDTQNAYMISLKLTEMNILDVLTGVGGNVAEAAQSATKNVAGGIAGIGRATAIGITLSTISGVVTKIANNAVTQVISKYVPQTKTGASE